jgi:CHASE1-domain containing sensor protein
LLFLLPIYRGGATPETMEARESSAFGWSYAPLALSEVLADFNMAQLHYDLAITDVSNPGQPELVFNSKKAPPSQKTQLHQTLEREVFGRLWRFDLSERPGFVENLHLLSTRSVLAVSLPFSSAGIASAKASSSRPSSPPLWRTLRMPSWARPTMGKSSSGTGLPSGCLAIPAPRRWASP